MKVGDRHVRERRWVVLGKDGRFVTLGRHSDPSEDEIGAAEASLRAQGLAGWLAIMEGNPHLGPAPRLLQVRPLASPESCFDHTAAACVCAIRARSTP
jgi:hypothetical protein